jgi:hypothetical protein
MIYILRFIKTGLAIQKFIGEGHTDRMEIADLNKCVQGIHY